MGEAAAGRTGGKLVEMLAKQGQRLGAVDMTVEKGIQPIMGGEGANPHLCCRFNATAPAAAEDDEQGDDEVVEVPDEGEGATKLNSALMSAIIENALGLAKQA